MIRYKTWYRFLATLLLVNSLAASAVSNDSRANQLAGINYDALAKSIQDLLTELVTTNTTNPPGNEERAVKIGASRLKAAGIPFEISEFYPGRQNLVARLKGTGQKRPILLLAHLDVVSPENQPWTSDPHKLTEINGYLQGRGVADDLGFAATSLELLIFLKKSGIQLQRDVILAWTGDEESGGGGIQHILKNNRDSIDALFALNEGGVIQLDKNGQPLFASVQVAEKTYTDFELIANGPTGHSSVPPQDNSIYRLSRALNLLSRYRFPARLSSVTRSYFSKRAEVESSKISSAMTKLSQSKGNLPETALKVLDANPMTSALLHTTCVATQLSAGINPNSLPAEAKANVNCRILPDETLEGVRKRLIQVIRDPQIQVRPTQVFTHSPASSLEGEGLMALKKVIHQLWPNLPIIPTMSTGATDSRYLRAAGIPSYGISPIALEEEDIRRYHAADERISKASVRTGAEFFHRLVVELGK